jgi:hypothetical protein
MNRSSFALQALLVCAGLALAPVCAWAADEILQDHTQFGRALTDDTLRPTYVKVTIATDKGGKGIAGCIFADALLSAIHIEMNYPFDYVNNKTLKDPAVRLALASREHKYYFQSPQALDAVKLDYSPADLDRARRLVKSYGTDVKSWPKAQLNSTAVTNLRKHGALACALIEEGGYVQRNPLTDLIE